MNEFKKEDDQELKHLIGYLALLFLHSLIN